MFILKYLHTNVVQATSTGTYVPALPTLSNNSAVILRCHTKGQCETVGKYTYVGTVGTNRVHFNSQSNVWLAFRCYFYVMLPSSLCQL